MLRRIADGREWGLEVSKSLASRYRKPEGASEMIPIPRAYSRLPKKHSRSLTSRHLLSLSHARCDPTSHCHNGHQDSHQMHAITPSSDPLPLLLSPQPSGSKLPRPCPIDMARTRRFSSGLSLWIAQERAWAAFTGLPDPLTELRGSGTDMLAHDCKCSVSRIIWHHMPASTPELRVRCCTFRYGRIFLDGGAG